MFKTFEIDRKYIENKYHKVDEPFDPFKRRAYHGYDFDESTGLDDDSILELLSSASQASRDTSHAVIKANAIATVLENTRIDVSEHDYFIGIWSVNRLISKTTKDIWYNDVFDNIIPETKRMMDDFNRSGAISIWPDFDHVVPNWSSLLELGFVGIRERARAYRQKSANKLTAEGEAFFEAIEIEYTAIIKFIDRVYNYARKQTHPKAGMIAASLDNLRKGAPLNTFDALQSIYIYFMISECVDMYQVRSLGNGLDNSLYHFYRADIENGTFTREEIKELLAYFFMQWSAIGNYWGQPFYLGGTNTDGTTKINDLSYDIIDVYDEIGIYNPKIQIKFAKSTPKDFICKVLKLIRRGTNSFVFCCEPGHVKAIMSYGATYEEALNADIRGCYETGVMGNEVSTLTGYINAAKAVEYVFSNGFDVQANMQIGIKSGEISSFKDFDAFYNAVLAQWEYLIECSIKMSNSYERYFEEINPSSMYSATIEGSLAGCRDAYQGGVRFNNSAVLNCGFATLVDSVMVVKEFVFDKQIITLEQLRTALAHNWNGYSQLRSAILKSPNKYGNDNEQVDAYAKKMASFFADMVNNRPNARGGVYKAIMHTARQYISQGKKTLATPDGRLAGTEISKNASPSIGMDKNGVTSMIKSALKLKQYQYPEALCLDVFLHPSATEGDSGLEAMYSLLTVYMENDGMSLQFNVMNSETLKDAQIHPDRYKNLMVRVCGWNVLWNNMSLAEQEAYILRAENIM